MEEIREHIDKWLKNIGGQIVPPLCVEIFLRDGRSYYLDSVLFWDEDDSTALIRVWDLREIPNGDIGKLKEAMNKVSDRQSFGNPEGIYKNLDWVNLRIQKDYIVYVIEWHDRLWPIQELGFKAKNSSDNA